MERTHGYALLVVILTACSGKERPFATEATPNTTAPVADVMGPSNAEQQPPTPFADSPIPATSGGESSMPADVQNGVGSSDAVLGATDTSKCTVDAGNCSLGDAGASEAPPCVPTGPRQCMSGLDNDCDGQPDNRIDGICRCVPGTTEACDTHPGLDGQGACRPGARVCILGEGNFTSEWGACEGSVAPLPADSCATAGDDSDCDGIPSEGCLCQDGETQPCGPSTDEGVCQRGVSTCVGGSFQGCVGAVSAGSRNCGSPEDNDCDGRPDNTLDAICQCVIGSTRACDTHPQDGAGPCQAGEQQCDAGPGSNSSAFGACAGSVGPAAQDSCSVVGDDSNCNGIDNSERFADDERAGADSSG